MILNHVKKLNDRFLVTVVFLFVGKEKKKKTEIDEIALWKKNRWGYYINRLLVEEHDGVDGDL